MPLPQRAGCTCKHGDSTISDPRKHPAKGTGILTSAGCSKRQISVPDVDQNWSTQQADDDLKFAPWVTSAPVMFKRRWPFVPTGPSANSCRVALSRRITAGTTDGMYRT